MFLAGSLGISITATTVRYLFKKWKWQLQTFFKSFLLRSSFYSNILFLVPQCKPSRGRKRGICWCVDKYGVQLPGTDYSGGDIQCKDLESSNNNEWKSGRDHLSTAPSPPSPAPNHHVTQGPRLLSESHLYAPPSVHFKKFGLFFFLKSKKKKEEEKRKSKTKEQAEQKTPVFYFF